MSFAPMVSYLSCLHLNEKFRIVGAPDMSTAFITEVPILHLGEVQYLRYRMSPDGCPSWQ